MTLADRRYGAEIVTKRGRALPFDDAGCAAEQLATREIGLDEVSSVWVVDYTHPDSLIPATGATFVRSKEIKTPMGSGVIATSDRASADSLAQAFHGEVLTWTEILSLAERDFLGAH
jgi:copper chaperone NosL